MSEKDKKENILNSQNSTNPNFPKLYIKDKNLPYIIKSEKQNFFTKSRNMELIKKGNITEYSFYQYNPTKSTFYSKLEKSSITNNYKNNNINRYTITEPNHSHSSSLIKKLDKNEVISLSALYKMPDYKRKINNCLNNSKKSLSLNNNNITIKINDNQNNSNIYSSKMSDENNSISLNKNKYFITDINHIKKVNKSNNTITLNSSSNKSRINNDDFSKIPYIMKDRFYCDIEDKMEKQFEGRKFTHDHSVKDKIIKLRQVKEFWGTIFDFSYPLICTKRFHYVTKLIEDRKKMREINKIFNKINKEKIKKFYNLSEKKNNIRRLPKLYNSKKVQN